MTEDEKFDSWLRTATQDYRRVPKVPRDEMWQVIEASLSADKPQQVDGAARSDVRAVPSWRRYVPLALAATVLVAVGIQIGRRLEPATSTPLTPPQSAALDTGAINLGYARATVAHLGRAEALITDFRASSELDASASLWARDLLADTRLLMDSPASSDPRRRLLLQDLELTLAQLVQLDASASEDDLGMVQRSIERGALLMRLRNAVPAGFSGT